MVREHYSTIDGQMRTMQHSFRRSVAATVPAVAALAVPLVLGGPAPASGAATTSGPAAAAHARGTYTNPVSRDVADTYADPAVVRGDDGWWYAVATTDPLREGEGRRHLLPISRSRDLVHWSYVGDAFAEDTLPTWADRSRSAALWAPDIRKVGREYRMYYVVTETTVTGEPNDNAIGMATAPHPTGPWTDSGAPVVGPRRGASGAPGDFLWTFDSAAVRDPQGREHLFYGSYYGGIWHTRLDAAGRRATGRATQVAIDNKFEGAYVVRRGGWWYLFASTANCCAGPTTGYSVQVGRSRSLTGPFVDRQGVPLLASRAGGTPTIYQNGNRWIGAGHNAVVRDLAGQDWALYHAIDRSDPYLDGTDGINERPMLLDRLDWVDGWPVLNGGRGPSAGERPVPATRPGARRTPVPPAPRDPRPGAVDRRRSDEFSGGTLSPAWQQVRDPAVRVEGGALVWPVERTDLTGPGGTAGLLLRDAPRGDRWSVTTKVSVDLGVDAVRNYQQAGLVAYVDDDLFARLSHVAIWNTRQVEFGHELRYAGRTSYGGTIIGPPAATTWLRITARTDRRHDEVELTGWSSRDGRTWVRGGTWTLPADARIRVGPVAHGGTGDAPPATARFDWFRVTR